VTDNAPQKLDADDRVAAFLSEVLKLDAFFFGFGVAQFERVFNHGGFYLYPTGHRLINQGEEGRDLFVIYDGKVEVIRASVDRQIFLGPGDIFGEMAMLLGGKRNATVVTVVPSKIFFLPFQDLTCVMDSNPDLQDHLINLARRRL